MSDRSGEVGELSLTANEILSGLMRLHLQWSLDDSGQTITRDFRFKGFNKTISFVNAVAWIANHEAHHPDLQVGYNYCKVTLTTHDVGGLSNNDFTVARKIDVLLQAGIPKP
jgi:4a-hydroxytetrahydrobiopterin dehydratase